MTRNGLRWRDAPSEYGPHKTIYYRFIRWSRISVFNRIFGALTAKAGKADQLTIDATHLKAHRTAACHCARCAPELRLPNVVRRSHPPHADTGA